MKPILTTLTVLFFIGNVLAQDSKISATLSYPIPLGNNFVGDNYTGVIDIGIQYTFTEIDLINIGVSVNGSYLTFENESFTPSLRVNGVFIQPRIFGELNTPVLGKFRPSIGLGYTFISFSTSTERFDDGDIANENTDGFNLNIGASYNLTNKLFAHLQYDFFTISRADDVPDNSFNNRTSFIKIGVGYRF